MSFQVQLHVYDMSGGMAKIHSRQVLHQQIDGVWNTGVVVYGKEFYFGGGICYDLPARTPFGNLFNQPNNVGQPTKVVNLGQTEINEEFLLQMLVEIKDDFTPKNFHPISNNCNTFSDRVVSLLLGNGIAKDILDQPRVLFNNPAGAQLGQLLMAAQASLISISNPLFTDSDDQKYPIQIKKQGGSEEQAQQQPGANQDMEQVANQFNNLGVQQRQTTYESPQLGQVVEIQNQAHLAKIIKDSQGVIVDFWSQGCGPCVRFKPIYESAARGNKNKNIIFCSVDCDRARDVAQANVIRSIPQFSFFLNGKEHAKFVGADEHKFRNHLGELHQATMSKAGNHYQMSFKQFKPMNRLPTGFTATGQIDKMKEFISKLVSTSTVRVNHLQAWLKAFDIKNIGRDAIDQLVSLLQIAEDKSKIALVDLLRLIVLEERQAEYIFGSHWSIIDTCIIGYIESLDLKDKEARVIHNYHLASFKFLINAYQTAAGRYQMQDAAKGLQVVQFCTRSFLSCNVKTVYHSALCLFNHLLCYEAENKGIFSEDLEQALKAIDEILSDKDLTDLETLQAVLLCECRILYQNVDVCSWVEETFKLYFAETHHSLKKRIQQDAIKEVIEDVVQMVDLESKKQ